jgi:AhpD family alkylhydroperoxidase
MEQRINVYEKGHNGMKSLYNLGAYLAKSPVERSLRDLVNFRVSQINGCAYCLDMHSKDLRANGETEQRLYMVGAWRESPVYTKRECAALAWAEAITKIPESSVSNKLYQETLKQFSEAELIDLTLSVLASTASTGSILHFVCRLEITRSISTQC